MLGLTFICFFIISTISSIGMAIAFVEKGDDWPVSFYRDKIRWILNKIHSKLGSMLDCVVCTSFWTALVCDLFLLLISGGYYFCWPLTGFASLGITWLIYQILDSNSNTNSIISQIVEKINSNKG